MRSLGRNAMSESWSHFFSDAVSRCRSHQRLRERLVNRVQKNIVDFSCNDYLSLRCDKDLREAASTSECVGSGASPVLSGYSDHHQLLESRLAGWSGFADAIVFSSGYACNTGVIACLASDGDLILSDELNHASLIDGCRLSNASVHVFEHCSADSVQRFLSKNRQRYQRAILLTETVFSMDGDLAPMQELADACCRYDCGLVVDEAHACGVYGRTGAGLTEELDLHSNVLLKLGTLSKSIGAIGGFACGSELTIQYLINHCRSYLFSTAPAIPVARAATKAIELISERDEERRQLRRRSESLRNELRRLGLSVPEGNSPIIPVVVGSESNALQLGQALLNAGIYVPAIRPPTVPENTCRLRISLSVAHTKDNIASLLRTLAIETRHLTEC